MERFRREFRREYIILNASDAVFSLIVARLSVLFMVVLVTQPVVIYMLIW